MLPWTGCATLQALDQQSYGTAPVRNAVQQEVQTLKKKSSMIPPAIVLGLGVAILIGNAVYTAYQTYECLGSAGRKNCQSSLAVPAAGMVIVTGGAIYMHQTRVGNYDSRARRARALHERSRSWNSP